jgi:intein-encoded DNA endonuclease-like protein
MNKEKAQYLGVITDSLTKIGVKEENIFVDKNGSWTFYVISKIDPAQEAKIFEAQADINNQINKNVSFHVYPPDSLAAYLLKDVQPVK